MLMKLFVKWFDRPPRLRTKWPCHWHCVIYRFVLLWLLFVGFSLRTAFNWSCIEFMPNTLMFNFGLYFVHSLAIAYQPFDTAMLNDVPSSNKQPCFTVSNIFLVIKFIFLIFGNIGWCHHLFRYKIILDTIFCFFYFSLFPSLNIKKINRIKIDILLTNIHIISHIQNSLRESELWMCLNV